MKIMPYIPSSVVQEVKRMGLLTYLKNYEPYELVHFSGNTYTTRTHDSLKISNGKWMWWSRGIGGRSALDYLIKVKEYSFLEAVELLAGQANIQPPLSVSENIPMEKHLLLPKKNEDNAEVIAYLLGRGIDKEIIQFCMDSGRIYESALHHNAVFVGMDAKGNPKYAALRGTGTSFIGEANGSDKNYSFSIFSEKSSGTVHLFESAIDLLSYATLQKLDGKEWRKMYMSTLNQGYIRKLYNTVAEKYESVAKNVRTIMKTSLEYAFNKNVLATNPVKGINLPKKIKKTEYRVLKIDEKKTLTLPQVLQLIEASKETPIHMQILFAVLMGLRRSEINGLKYSDVDYIHRTLRVERQLGKKPNSKAEDCAPKMLTKQEIKTKTPAGVRELPIPDYVFEAILEERKTYEKNRRCRPKEFRDWNYICCSTYGNPRSKGFHQKYYKDLLKSLDLPDIHFHQLRNTYATILLKNSFNSKGVSHLLGHAKEIISVDVYGDTQEIIEDCLDVLEPFIEEVILKERKDQYYDYSEVIEIDLILEEYFNAA